MVPEYDADESHPARAAEATFRITALGAQGDSSGKPDGAYVRFVNRMGTLKQTDVELIAIGAQREAQVQLPATLAPRFYDVDVPEGTSRLTAEVALADGENADGANIALAIYYVTGKADPVVRRMAVDVLPGARKSLAIAAPRPGRYRISLDAWGAVPAAGIKVNYLDTVFRPVFGSAERNDTHGVDVKRHETVTKDISLAVRARPQDGRYLVADFGVFGESYMHLSLPEDGEIRRMSAIVSGKPVPKLPLDRRPVPLAVHQMRLAIQGRH